MIHLLVVFLLLVFMALMVAEPSIYVRTLYFIVCVILLAVYNVVHARGLKMSLEMLMKTRPMQEPAQKPAIKKSNLPFRF